MFKNSRKEDLIILLKELGEEVNSNVTVIDLKTKIENCECFIKDPTFVSDLLQSIVEDRKAKITRDDLHRNNQLELEKIRLAKVEKELAKVDKELQLQLARNESKNQINEPVGNEETVKSFNLESLIKSIKTLTIPVPLKSENFDLFFRSLERAFVLKCVPDEYKAEILLNVLGDKAKNVLLYIGEDELKDYSKVKSLILRELEPTAQECLFKFKRARREANETYVQFTSRLSSIFHYYCHLRGVSDFESLCELMISDKLFSCLEKDIMTHICIKQGEQWLKPHEMARESDIFCVTKGKSFSEVRQFENANSNSSRNTNTVAKEQLNEKMPKQNFKYNKDKQINCYICNQNHFVRNCPQRVGRKSYPTKDAGNTQNRNESQREIVKPVAQVTAGARIQNHFINELQYVDIIVDGIPAKGLQDSGASLLVVNAKLISHKKPSYGEIILTSCFNGRKTATLTKFMIAVPGREVVEVLGAFSPDISYDVIVPPNVLEMLANANASRSFFPTDCDAKQNTSNKIEADKNGNDFLSFCDENESNLFEYLPVNAIWSEDTAFDLSHVLDNAIKKELDELICNYKPNKIKNTNLKMSIVLKDDIPVCQRSRRLSFTEKQEIEKQIEDWLRNGIITESFSDYCSPVVLCRKKNNELRLCVDYRSVNRKMVKDKYPLPVMEEIFDRLGSSKVFTTLDMKNAFFHVDIEEKSRKYTSFATESGQYEFLKVPFGLANSPSVFQRYINQVFRELLKDNTLIIYLDDIIIPACDEVEGLQKLKRVLKTASEYGLELNLKKCQFMKRKIEFLGHIIENGEIRPSPEKTLAVQNFPEPKNAKQVQSFLGLTGYFRKFIPSYAVHARPLSDLLRKSTPFCFGPEQKQAFQRLKEIISQKPVLHLYKQGAKLELYTDACKLGFGAILFQQSDDGNFHPIHYMSRKTSAVEEKYCSYELEVLAIVEALKKFRNYLMGTKFKIVTDCLAFTMTMNKKDLTAKIARWALFLDTFDYTIEHRPGNRMQHVDALSRNTVCMITHDGITVKVIEAQETDENIKTIKQILKSGGKHEDYLIKGDILYKHMNGNDLLVVPEDMQMSVIKKAHEKGHFAVKITEENLNKEFYIPKLKQKIEKCIANCIPCILVNRKRGKKEGELHSIPKDDLPLETYHIDHLGPLQSTNKNYKHILCVIDAFTKFVWLYPTKSTSSREVISKLELQKSVFGNPTRIISDRGTAFNSKEFDEYCESESIQHICVTTGLPRANGQVERLNSVIISVIAKLSKDDPTKWYKFVPLVQQIINSTYQRSINLSPFELLVGVKMKQKSDLKIQELIEEEFKRDFMSTREMLRKEAKQQILKTQEQNKKTYNLRRKAAHKYKVNDVVAIKRTQFDPGLKLKPKFLGPYKVTKVKPNDTYDVQKLGNFDGPSCTSTCAEYMKPWPSCV